MSASRDVSRQMKTRLSNAYQARYEAFLAEIAASARIEPVPVTVFWPMVGDRWDGGMLVVGRAPNGWRTEREIAEFTTAGGRRAVALDARGQSEDSTGCPMRWVTDAAGNAEGYNTNRSAFWRVTRAVCLAAGMPAADPATWSSHIAWTDLAKIAPAAGFNPGGGLLSAQRRASPALLAAELDELRPADVLVLTGGWWFAPFAAHLGLTVEWRDGPLEGVATDAAGRRWAVAPHPQGKPEHRIAAAAASLFVARKGAHDRPDDLFGPDRARG